MRKRFAAGEGAGHVDFWGKNTTDRRNRNRKARGGSGLRVRAAAKRQVWLQVRGGESGRAI